LPIVFDEADDRCLIGHVMIDAILFAHGETITNGKRVPYPQRAW
jgi:hypothetical protein